MQSDRIVETLPPTRQQPSARHGGNLQRASPNLWVSVFRSLFIVFHCILHCHCSVSTLFIVLNGFGVSGLKRNSNHKLERRDDPFKLRENGTKGFGAETQPQPQINFKIKTQPKNAKRFVVSVLSRERKHPETPNPFNYNENSRIGQWQCKPQ